MLRSKLPLNKNVTVAVYAIRNILNEKIYIGSAVKVRRRWYTHRCHLRRNKSNCTKLQNSWNVYGETAFVFEIVEEVFDVAKLIERERHWIKHFKATDAAFGLNILKANEVHLGPTREKMRVALVGKRASIETRAKMSASHKGKVRSAEHCANLSAALMGRKLSPEHRAKCGSGNRGKKNEFLRRLAISRRGIPRSQETKAKISATLMGRKHSEQRIKNIVAGRWSFK